MGRLYDKAHFLVYLLTCDCLLPTYLDVLALHNSMPIGYTRTYLVMAPPGLLCVILLSCTKFARSKSILFSCHLLIKSTLEPITAGKELKSLRRENQKSALVAGLILALGIVMYILFTNPS